MDNRGVRSVPRIGGDPMVSGIYRHIIIPWTIKMMIVVRNSAKEETSGQTLTLGPKTGTNGVREVILILLLSILILCLVFYGYTFYLTKHYGENRKPPIQISSLPLVEENDLPPIWKLNLEPREIRRGDMFVYGYPFLEVSHYIEKDYGYFDQMVFDAGNPIGAMLDFNELYGYQMDWKWFKENHVDLPGIHADTWVFGCEKIEIGNLCQGLFRYKQYNTYFFLNPPEEFVDLDGIIEIVYLIDKKMSDQIR